MKHFIKDKAAADKLKADFTAPPQGYGVIMFYWWLGDKLTKERIRWQLDKIRDHSVIGLQIAYAHDNKGGRYLGLPFESDPKQRTEKWWELFNWFVQEGRKEGFAVSLSDYTLGWPGQGEYGDDILEDNPEITGSLLKAIFYDCRAGDEVDIIMPPNTLSAGAVNKEKGIKDLLPLAEGNKLCYKAYYDCSVTIVYPEEKEYSLDPMHPLLGKEVCKRFYQTFLDRNPGEGGKGINYFFSDELSFGIRGNLWNRYFADEFKNRKGYDILPYLPALFAEAGDITAKIRLDYYDVIVQLEEEHYFKPLYDWHESNGMIFGGDHGGRGRDITEFGDYFRTQKYNQGPGCDQSHLQSDIIKNKVASSISHLYQRPRVWLEGFWGSGWGTSSAGLQDAIARNFCMGQNLLSIHGFYYSTHGGWWEWAPPCNAFRMPYWDDLKHLLKATERLSYLLTRGVHCCDIAIVYPVAAVEGGYDGEESVNTAFACAEALYRRGIDLDFIDFVSIERAEINNGRLEVSGESYRIIVLPSMKTVRFAMIKKLLEFRKAGGIVVNIGSLPEHSDNKGGNDEELNSIVEELASDKAVLLDRPEDLVPLVKDLIQPDFIAEYNESDVYVNHRNLGQMDLYMVYGAPKGTKCFFRSTGRVSLWNPYDGKVYSISDVVPADGGTYINLPMQANEFQVIIFDRLDDPLTPDGTVREISFFITGDTLVVKLDDEWDFELLPCLDNKYGDFYLPASEEMVGPWIYRLDYCETDCEDPPPREDYKRKALYTHGPYFLHKGKFSSDDEYNTAIEDALRGNLESFGDYNFSMRYNVEHDPGEQGFHGLKANISDDFFIIGSRQENWAARVWYENFPGKFGEVFYTNLYVDKPTAANIIAGGLKPDDLYVNGVPIEDISEKVPLNKGYNSVVIGYKNPGRTHVLFAKGDILPQEYPLAMKWYRQPNIIPFDSYAEKAAKYCFFRFDSPPALMEVELPTDLKIKVWIDGIEANSIEKLNNKYRIKIDNVSPYSAEVVIRAEYEKGKYRGAVFEEPIKLKCGKGRIKSGDWSEIDGLRGYSGGARYSGSLMITKEWLDKQLVLEMEDIVSSVRLFINGEYAGTKVAPPWQFDISDYVMEGKNTISLEIYNTLSNHYDSIPTNYRGDLKSGLVGDCKLYII